MRNRHLLSGWGNGLAATTGLFKGNCPEGKTVAECRDLGLDPGQMWRPDSYQEFNTTLDMRERYNTCKGNGLTGAALHKCAAPNDTGWPN